MLYERANSVCYIYNADFYDFEQIRKAIGEEKLMESMGFQSFDHALNVIRKSEQKNTSHDMFRPNDIDNFCDLTRTLVTPSLAICYVLRLRVSRSYKGA